MIANSMKPRALGLLASLALSHAVQGQPQPLQRDPYEKATFKSLPVTIPVTLAGPQILIDGIMVNDKGPFRFLLDTGAMGGGRVDVSLVEKLGLEKTGEVLGSDGSGRAGPTMPEYQLDSLKVGPLEYRAVHVISRDYNEHAAAARGHIDGILGIGLFRDLILTIDYPASEVRIDKGSLPMPNLRDVVPLIKDAHVPTTHVTLGGKKYEAHIDTGSMGGLTVSGGIAEDLTFQGEPVEVGEARTVSGPFKIKAATLVGDIQIGGLVISGPEITIAGPMRDVNLGGRFLQDFAITLDQANHRVRFASGDSSGGTSRRHVMTREGNPPNRRYGIMVGMSSNGPLSVEGTMPGSIAEKAGLRKGDIIVRINDLDIAQLDAAKRGELLRTSPVTMLVERDGKKIEVKMSFNEPEEKGNEPRSDAQPGPDNTISNARLIRHSGSEPALSQWEIMHKSLSGKYRIEARMWKTPSAKPVSFSGTSSWSSVHGRYLHEAFELFVGERTLAGDAFLGPAAESGDYELVQIDGFNPGITQVRGRWNQKTGTLTMESTDPDDRLLKWTYRLLHDGVFIKELHRREPDGSWRLASDYRYTPQARD